MQSAEKKIGSLLERYKGRIAPFVILVLVFLLFSLTIYHKYIGRGVVKEINTNLIGTIGQLEKGDRIVQKLKLNQKKVQAITLAVATYDNQENGEGSIRFSLEDCDSGKTLAAQELDTAQMYHNMNFEFEFSAVEAGGREIQLVIEPVRLSDSATISFYLSEQADEVLEPCMVNGESMNGALKLAYRYPDSSYMEKLVGMSLLIFFLCILAVYELGVCRQMRVQDVYLIAVILLGGIYLFLMPTFSTPDEGTHLYKSIQVSNYMMFKGTSADEYEMRVCEKQAMDAVNQQDLYHLNRNNYNFYYTQLFHGDDASEWVHVQHECLTTPRYQYFVSGLGITVGRLLGLNAYKTFALGSLFNFILFIIVTYVAVSWFPFGKTAAAVLCLMPITLQQATSHSYDCMIICMALLFLSAVLRIMYDEKAGKGVWIVMTISAVLFVSAKTLAYLPALMILICAGLRVRKVEKKLAVRMAVLAGVMIAGAVVIQILGGAGAVGREEGSIVVEWAEQPGYTLGELLRDPLSALDLIWNTIQIRGDYYFQSLFGGKLSWMTVDVSIVAVLTYMFAIILSAMPKRNEQIPIQTSTRVIFFVSFILCLACIVGGILISWTPLSYDFVEGVQGRYLIPVLLFAVFACRGKGIMITDKMERCCMAAAVVVQPFMLEGILAAM